MDLPYDNNLIDNLIADIIHSNNISHNNLTVSEVKEFLPIFINTITKDQYVTNILENLPDNINNITAQQLNELTTNDENELEEYELSKELGPHINETKHNKLIRLLKNIFKKLIYTLMTVKNQDQLNEKEYFSWQSYVKNRELNRQQGTEYTLTIKPNQDNISINISNKIDNLFELDLSKNEINLLIQAQKYQATQKNTLDKAQNISKETSKDSNYNFIKNTIRNITMNNVKDNQNYKHNIQQQQGENKLWTNWKETGRTQEGNTTIIKLQSEYITQGTHKSVPPLPSF